MKNQHLNSPNDLIAALQCGPKIIKAGPFWTAYNHLRSGNTFRATETLHRSYTTECYYLDNRCQRISDLIHIAQLGQTPTASIDWIQFLAEARAHEALHQLYQAQRAEAVHIVHALLEANHDFFLEELYHLTATEAQALLELYAIETELISATPNASEPLKTWLSNRNQRAQHKIQSLHEANEAS